MQNSGNVKCAKTFPQLRMLQIFARYSAVGLEARKFYALLNINALPFIFSYCMRSFFIIYFSVVEMKSPAERYLAIKFRSPSNAEPLYESFCPAFAPRTFEKNNNKNI